jgi:hypothetical protein
MLDIIPAPAGECLIAQSGLPVCSITEQDAFAVLMMH